MKLTRDLRAIFVNYFRTSFEFAEINPNLGTIFETKESWQLSTGRPIPQGQQNPSALGQKLRPGCLPTVKRLHPFGTPV